MCSIVTKRNQMVQAYKISQIPPEVLIRIFYGFPIPPGHLDQEYSDTMDALYVQTDDIIFFSSQLAEDLCAYADELVARFKRKFGNYHLDIAGANGRASVTGRRTFIVEERALVSAIEHVVIEWFGGKADTGIHCDEVTVTCVSRDVLAQLVLRMKELS